MKNKIIHFDVESAELMEEDPTSRFAWAKIQAFSSGENRHNLICDEDTLERTSKTIYNTPVMYEVRYGNDFGTHTEPGKSMIAGFVVPNSAEFIRLPDGRLSMTILSRIWKMYAPKAMEIFKRGNSKKVSVEMELLDSEPMENGWTKMKDFVYTGVQLLGDMVVPASPSAHAVMLSFSDAKKKYEEDLRIESSPYKNIDFSIPQNVKDNASSAISTYKDGEQEATATALSVGKYLTNNSTASPEKLKSIHKYLSKNIKDPKKYLSCLMYGGSEGLDWVDSIISKMDQEELKNKEEKVDGLEEKEVLMEAPEEEKTEQMSEEEAPEVEKPEDEKEEEREESEEKEDEEEEEEAEMSLDTNLDIAAILAMLENETEDYQELVDGHKAGNPNFAKICNGLYGKICKMQAKMAEVEEQNKAYMAENESLKSFKAQYEQREFNFAVERVLSEVSNIMPVAKIQEQREDALNFDLSSLDAWENKTKAIAFSYAKDVKKPDGHTRVGLPFGNTDAKANSSIWKR